jgi:predicted RNase H-like HicB family nuclease
VIRELKIQIRVVIEPDGDVFHAFVPDLKGVHACGDTESEALTAIREGASLYIQSLVKHNESIPVGLVRLDRNHTSMLAMAWCLIKEGLGLTRKHSSLQEITLPAFEFATN